jgi:hypothetical protein
VVITLAPLVLPVFCALVGFNVFHRMAEVCCACWGSKANTGGGGGGGDNKETERGYNFKEEVASTELFIKGGVILAQERQNQQV